MAKNVTKTLLLIAALLCSAQLASASEFRVYTSSTVSTKCSYSYDGEAGVIINDGEKHTSGDWYTINLLHNDQIYNPTKSWSTTADGDRLQLSGLAAGYYSLSLTDANNKKAITTFLVPSPSAIVTTVASVTDINCSGEASGIVTMVVTGGKEPYTIICKDARTGNDAGEISVINNNIKISKLYAGKFKIKVTDYYSCTPASDTDVEIRSPFDAIVYNPSSNNVTCYGTNTGKIFGEAQGGKLPFIYSITNNTQPYTAGNNTGTFEGLPIGSYTATATDALGCKVTVEDVIVGTPEEISVQDIDKKPADTVVCEEDKTASIKFTVKGRLMENVVASSDTAIFYSVKLFNITEQHPVAVTDFTYHNSFHPVFRQEKKCKETIYIQNPETGEIEEKIIEYVCGMDTLFEKGCHEPTKDRGSMEYPTDSLGYDCDDYITISGLGKGAYRIEFYRGACQMGTYKEFTIEQTGGMPQTVNINALDPICDGSELTVIPEIIANPRASRYEWTLGGILIGTSRDLTHTYEMAEDKRILQLEVSNACGSKKSNEAQISVLPRPKAKVSADDKFLCEGNDTDITIEFKGTAPFIYTLTGEEEASTFEAVVKTTVKPQQTAAFTLTELSDANCTAIIAKDVTPDYITIYPKHSVALNVTVPDPMVSGRYVTAEANPATFVSYNLEMNGENIPAAGPASLFKIRNFPYGESTQEYLLTVVDANGCEWTATASSSVKIDVFPNIFTPNGDGVNDIFLEGWDIEVFDRWGTVMFTGTSGWDGKHNGVFANPGVYLYVVKLTDQSGQPVVVKKTVTVER